MIYTLYLSSLIASAAIAMALAYFFWRRRSKPGAIAMLLAILAAAIMSLGYVLQYTSASLSTQIFAGNFQYIGIMALPVMWVVFSLQYTDHSKWLTRRNLLLLSIIPFATVVIVWTNGIDGLMYHGRHLDTSGPFVIIAKTYGPWFWIAAANNYLLMLYGMFFLIQRLFRHPRLYRQQSIALVFAMIVPLAWNIIYIFNLTPLYHVDLTPSAFVISGLAIGWGLFRVRLFDIIPIARNTIVESMSDGIVVLDVGNRLVDLNRAAERIAGCTLSEAIGKPITNVLSGHPKLVELLGMIRVSEEQLEVEVKKGETQRYYNLHTLPLCDQRGQFAGRLVVLTDITGRKQAEKTEQQLEEELYLASRLATVGEMSAGIAHEINNPLTGVIGFSELLLKKDLSDDIKKDVGVIHSGAKRIASITDRMLAFARQREPSRDSVNINDIIGTALTMRAYEMESSNIKVTTQLDPDIPLTYVDAGQLQQVFLNIILNAEMEMKLAHGKGNLTVKAERIDNTIRISFKDDGPGIPKKNLERLFDPFFTTRDPDKGTGLGLSVSYSIVTQHGGKIYAQSRLGRGATFFVELPTVTQAEQLELDEPVSDVPKKVSGARILVVDDEPIVQQFLTEILSEEGHRVDIIDNGNDAPERLGSENYDAILLDIKLPGISGIDLYEYMQRSIKSLAKRVIFITGDVMNGNTTTFLSKTRAPYLTKPFDAEQLKKAIDHILSQ